MMPNRRFRPIALPLLLAICLSGCGVFGGKGGPKTPTLGNRVPVLSRIDSAANPDAALAGVTVVIPPAQTNPDWPQAGGPASKSYGHLAMSASPSRSWSASISGSSKRQRLAASPVVGDGRLFAMGTDGMVSAFDARSGTRLSLIHI